MKLSPRLQLIAKMVPSGAILADIGTDHGFLPMYLMAENIAKHVILCDVNEGPLEKARGNLVKAGFDPAFWDIRKGDGLGPLAAGEADTVVIAGMGGLLIRDILAADAEKTQAVQLFLLQPRTETGALRQWLLEQGWTFAADRLVREGKFICEVLAAEPPRPSARDAAENAPAAGMSQKQEAREGFPGVSQDLQNLCASVQWEVSPLWFASAEDRPLLQSLLTRKYSQEKGVLQHLAGAAGPEAEAKRAYTEARLEALCSLQRLCC